MPNHYHLLIKTKKPNLSSGMRQLNGIYSQNFNLRNDKVGHVFQGRFKSILVEEEKYKYKLIRYISLNPLRAGLVRNVNDWKWGSSTALIDGKVKDKCINVDKILSQFDEDISKARKIYKEYLNRKINSSCSKKYESASVLLTSEYRLKLKKYFDLQKNEYFIPKSEKYAYRLKLDEIFNDKSVTRGERNLLIFEANTRYFYSVKILGEYLKLDKTYVAKIIKSLREK